MAKKADPIPKHYHSLSPILVLRDAAEALTFYEKAFDAKVLFRHDRPDGKLMHAALKIGDSVFMLGEECAPHEGHENCVRSPQELGGTTVNLYLYTKDVDKAYRQAIDAGAEDMMAVEDMFWGDRMGMVKDPYGYVWSIATHTEELSDKEMQQRMQEFMAQHTS
ncbi:MAG: VOC family protein [Planctomycetaceae bacterium]|nr:VOC family protein [Planctomycetaceae bacterium]